MLELDGSIGGGSVVRLSLGLSIATGTPFRIDDVRANRENPGLKHQHLAAVRAAAELSNAEVEGDELGSSELEFVPGKEISRSVKAEIPTAGSVGLLLQPLWIASTIFDQEVSVTVDGGATAGKWAPPVHYLQEVAFPSLERRGVPASADIGRHGFYPEGGALIYAEFGPSELDTVSITDREGVEEVRGLSVASEHLRDAEVAERQRKEARKALRDYRPSIDLDIESRYVESSSPGSSILVWSDGGSSVLGGDSVGEKGKRAEKVGREAAEELVEAIDAGSPLDNAMSDMIVPFLGLSGGEVEVHEVTDHVESNIEITNEFVEKEVRREGRKVVAE